MALFARYLVVDEADLLITEGSSNTRLMHITAQHAAKVAS